MTVAVSLVEEIFTAFFFFVSTLGVGAGVAIYTYFMTGAVPYRMGKSKRTREKAVGNWYAGLRKPSFTPGTWGYAIGWTVGYVFFAYAAWRFWMVPVAVREGTLGLVILSFVVAHWFMLPIVAYLFLGMQSLAWSMFAQFLNLGTVAVIASIMLVIHLAGSAVLIGPLVAIFIYAALHLISLIVHLGFWKMNPNNEGSEY